MIDMLVRLYDLPCVNDKEAALAKEGIIVRRPNPYERHIVTAWIGKHFSPKWVSETKVAFSHQPITCYIATLNQQVIGFACYDVTARGFFGPTGVDPDIRSKGLGTVLLVRALEHLKAMGFAYAVIGGVGPEEFYKKTVGAIPIEGSTPGIYKDILLEPQ